MTWSRKIMSINSNLLSAKILMYSTSIVILTVGMRQIAPILTPILFSVFAALILTPYIHWLKQKGVPGRLSVLLMSILFAFIVAGLGVVIFGAAIQFGDQIPIYQTRLIEFINILTHHIPPQEELSANTILRGIASTVISLMSSIIQGLLNARTTAGIIILMTAFLLIDATNSPGKINSEFKAQSKLKMSMSRFDKNLVEFLVIRAETNLITAVGITVALLIGGIDFAILWGVLIFLLSYISYIGLVLASIPPKCLRCSSMDL
jgi:AI-2 transport protein TqsA